MTSPADTVEEVMRLPEPALPVAYYCNKCGYLGPVGESHFVSGAVGDGGNPVMCNYLAVPSGPYWDRTAVEKLVAERDEAKKAAYGARLLIADVIADRDRLAAQVEELRARLAEAERAKGEPVAWRSEDWKIIVRSHEKWGWPSATIPMFDAAPQPPEQPQGAQYRPVGRVEKHTGDLKDMAIIVWTDKQPKEGMVLYVAD